MSAGRNTDALANQEDGGSGQFRSRIERDEPMMTGGHQPGKLVGNDAAPEFSAQTLPAGTAPADRTFQPNNADEITPVTKTSNDIDPDAPETSAADTLGGATSQDVHTGLGHPGSGQSSAELRHDGESHRKNPGASLEGVGASGVSQSGINPHNPDFADQRALDRDDAELGRGNTGGLAAQERVPEGAETVASEN